MRIQRTWLVLVPVIVWAVSGCAAWAQAPVGDWITVDDARNRPRSRVTLYLRRDTLYARVDSVYRFPGEPEDPVCIACSGALKDQPVEGMVILWGMVRDGDAWTGGRILDPENGKTYRCKLWVEDGRLRVRGYWGPFHRTQTWLPAP